MLAMFDVGVIVGACLFMTSERSLQLIYDQLFGTDEDDHSAITSTALQAGLSLRAVNPATSPVIFDQPNGLILYKSWLSQQQQVLLWTTPLVSEHPFPLLCDFVGTSLGMHHQ